MIPIAILDPTSIKVGETAADALRNSRELAQHADDWGYERLWVTEHHNMPGVASAAVSVVVGYLAGATSRIRIGAGGVMLPNHSPLVIAEQFGTLESLYPGRIDLGLGRAPGADQRTWQALRRDYRAAERFPEDIQELQALFGPLQQGQAIQAVPGTNLKVPLWVLGSSTQSAQLSAQLGLPYSFASHFSPTMLDQALQIYHQQFKHSAQLSQPYTMPCINVVIADTDAEARRLFTSLQQTYTQILRNQWGKVAAPIDDIDSYWGVEKSQVQSLLANSCVGSVDSVRAQLQQFLRRTHASELMVCSPIVEQDALLRSYELLATIRPDL